LTSLIPDASVRRLPLYLRVVVRRADDGAHTISSAAISEGSGVNPSKVRKDLSYLGSNGTRGVGYDTDQLIHQITSVLGLTRDWGTVLVGVGDLGHALAKYGGFSERGFRLRALLDVERLGERVDDLTIEHVGDAGRIVPERGISIAVIAVPARAAQPVADRLVAAGVTSILNFAPVELTVPEGISLRKVDLSLELQILAFYEERRQADRAVRAGAFGLNGAAVSAAVDGETEAGGSEAEAGGTGAPVGRTPAGDGP